jgi:hypothetical protein
MSLFDTIEVNEDVKGGPFAGEYQTKDLDKGMDNYILQDKKLYKRLMKYSVVPEEERTHPIFGCLSSKFIGLVQSEYSGEITIYSPYTTWELEFVNGELVNSELLEVYAGDPDTGVHSGDYTVDCDGNFDSYSEFGDEEEFYFDIKEYK